MTHLSTIPASASWYDIFLFNCLFSLSHVQLLKKLTDFDKIWFTAQYKSHLEMDL